MINISELCAKYEVSERALLGILKAQCIKDEKRRLRKIEELLE